MHVVTPQTNTTLEEIAERIYAFDDFVICGHVNPDGDCLGSEMGLFHALVHLGKHAQVLLARNEPIDLGLEFLPGTELLTPAAMVEERDWSQTCFIAVDVPTPERLGDAAAIQAQAGFRITLDHHACQTSMSELNYVDPDAAAASLLIWMVAAHLGALNQKVAQCCLCGLITDTGRFAYQNTNAEAFLCAAAMVDAGGDPALVNREFFQNRSVASFKLEKVVLDRLQFFEEGQFVMSHLTLEDFKRCHAVKADAEVLIDELRSIHGVRVAMILRENDQGEVRGSLRAKDEDTDVAQVARSFDGGGHKAAAGFTFHGTMDDALVQTKQRVLSLCFADGEEA